MSDIEQRPRSAGEVLRDLERVRSDLAQASVALRRRVEDLTHPRTWVRRHPMRWFVAAFALGFALGYRG